MFRAYINPFLPLVQQATVGKTVVKLLLQKYRIPSNLPRDWNRVQVLLSICNLGFLSRQPFFWKDNALVIDVAGFYLLAVPKSWIVYLTAKFLSHAWEERKGKVEVSDLLTTNIIINRGLRPATCELEASAGIGFRHDSCVLKDGDNMIIVDGQGRGLVDVLPFIMYSTKVQNCETSSVLASLCST